MTTYISQKQAREERHQLKLVRKKLRIAKSALEEIAGGISHCETPGCACCTPIEDGWSWTEHCDLGNARVALHEMARVGK